ncbi:MAG: helix-turn-helix transcriptional regulator [Clostridiales bacterium]|nr:helix-turn-helix transcriptional regulator [Clostridiales bacterium]
MPKIFMNEDIGNALKKMRLEKNILIADIAKELNFSIGYISNLENYKTKTTDLKKLYKLIDYLTYNSEDNKKILLNHLSKQSIKLSGEEIEDFKSSINNREQFDLQYRTFNITDELISFISNELQENNIKPIEVIKELNKNTDLTEEEKNCAPEMKNKIIFSKDNSYTVIVFDLEINFLDKIISGEIKSCNYIILNGILYAINLLKGLDVANALLEAKHSLYKNKIYTLSEIQDLKEKENLANISNNLLSQFDEVSSLLPQDVINFYKSLKGLIILLEKLSDKNKPYITESINSFITNLKNVKTRSMMLALMGLNLENIKGLTASEQQEIFTDIKNVIKNYKSNTEEKIIELK